MKKRIRNIIVIITVIIGMTALSSFTYYQGKNHNQKIYLDEMEYNGHLYTVAYTERLLASGATSGLSLVHSPNCKCGKE